MLTNVNVHIDKDTPIRSNVFLGTAAIVIGAPLSDVTLFIRDPEDAGRFIEAINEAISRQAQERMPLPDDGTSPQLAQYQAEGR